MIPIVIKNDLIRTDFVLIKESIGVILKDVNLEYRKAPYALTK